MTRRIYFSPIDIGTGGHCVQPNRRQTQPDWHLDRNRRWQDTGFLDAPHYLPLGGTVGVDSGDKYTIGCGHVWRDGTFV